MMRTSEPADRRAPGPVAAATWRLVPRSLINGTPSLYGSGTPASRREPDRPSHARVVAPGRLVGGLTRHVVEPHTSTGSPPSQLPQFRSTPARNGVATRPAQLSRSGPWPAPGGAPLTGLLLRAPAGSAAWQRRSAGADMPHTPRPHDRHGPCRAEARTQADYARRGACRSAPGQRHPERRTGQARPATGHRRSGQRRPPPHRTGTPPAPGHHSRP
jgi:hypothetical protein